MSKHTSEELKWLESPHQSEHHHRISSCLVLGFLPKALHVVKQQADSPTTSLSSKHLIGCLAADDANMLMKIDENNNNIS